MGEHGNPIGPANNETSRTPHTKVAAGGIAAAISAVLVWVLTGVGVTMPAEIASAVTTLIGFGVAYLTPPKSGA